MGCIPHIPNPDEHSPGKKYTKFLIVLEILYAILVAWGFARIAEFFVFENPYNWAGLLVAAFVLIRFFFAPSHNVGGLIRSTHITIGKARFIIFFDIPVLLAHSLIYYRLCYNLSLKEYELFYLYLAFLLLLNAGWLVTIRFRMRREGVNTPGKFCLWINNNLIFSILLLACYAAYKFTGMFSFSAFFWASFAIAMTNCVVDLSSCALNYFEEA